MQCKDGFIGGSSLGGWWWSWRRITDLSVLRWLFVSWGYTAEFAKSLRPFLCIQHNDTSTTCPINAGPCNNIANNDNASFNLIFFANMIWRQALMMQYEQKKEDRYDDDDDTETVADRLLHLPIWELKRDIPTSESLRCYPFCFRDSFHRDWGRWGHISHRMAPSHWSTRVCPLLPVPALPLARIAATYPFATPIVIFLGTGFEWGQIDMYDCECESDFRWKENKWTSVRQRQAFQKLCDLCDLQGRETCASMVRQKERSRKLQPYDATHCNKQKW